MIEKTSISSRNLDFSSRKVLERKRKNMLNTKEWELLNDHIADVNLCYSEHARRYLNAEGTAKERTYVTGSPMAEVLDANFTKIKKSTILDSLGLEPQKYILLSAHREENIDDEHHFFELMGAVNAMAEKYEIPIIYSTHPRSKKFIEERGFHFHPFVKQLKPFSFSDYNHLQMNAFCVVSDSGTLPEEAAYFNTKNIPFPAVCIRTSTERPEAIDKGVFIIGSITRAQVLQAVNTAVTLQDNDAYGSNVPDYIDKNVSTKIIKIIQSYTAIINKVVWRKEGGM